MNDPKELLAAVEPRQWVVGLGKTQLVCGGVEEHADLSPYRRRFWL
jgi:hypothetical protein